MKSPIRALMAGCLTTLVVFGIAFGLAWRVLRVAFFAKGVDPIAVAIPGSATLDLPVAGNYLIIYKYPARLDGLNPAVLLSAAGFAAGNQSPQMMPFPGVYPVEAGGALPANSTVPPRTLVLVPDLTEVASGSALSLTPFQGWLTRQAEGTREVGLFEFAIAAPGPHKLTLIYQDGSNDFPLEAHVVYRGSKAVNSAVLIAMGSLLAGLILALVLGAIVTRRVAGSQLPSLTQGD